MLPEPRITVRAGWWRRRVLRRQVRRLWRLASGRHPAVVSDRDFRRLDDELRSLRAALTQGILQLEPAR